MNQKGFSLVEVLLVIIAITLLSGLGLYSYNSIKKEDAQKAAVTTKAEAEAEPKKEEAKQDYFEFPELGVKIVLPTALEGLKYEVDDVVYGDGTKDRGLSLSSTEFDATVKAACEGRLNGSAFARLDKGSGDYNVAVKKAEGAKSADYYPGKLLKQFDEFFIDYTFNPGGFGCYEEGNSKIIDKSEKLQGALEQAFKSAEIIK